MKSFQAIIIAAIFAAASAANEPVASPAAANIERELAEYEKRHLDEKGTPATSPPSDSRPSRPPSVSSLCSMISHLLLQLRDLKPTGRCLLCTKRPYMMSTPSPIYCTQHVSLFLSLSLSYLTHFSL